tara:strand:+ start:1321 stop:2757 length:1437 start_codon:yes stop_codon:yes gene_type:complete
MATVSLPSGENFVLNPTSVALATQDNYVSSLTTLAMHKREVDERLIQRYGKQGITGLLELVGAKKECTQTQFEHFEEAFIHNTVSLDFNDGGVPTSGAAKEVMHINDSDLSDGTLEATNQHHPVRLGDICLSETGQMGIVTSAPTSAAEPLFDMYPINTWNSSNANGQTWTIIGNEWGENTSQPDSILPRVHEYSNKCMIIKESFEVSGTEATNVIYFKVDSQHFGSGYLWYLKGEADTYKRFMDYQELMMILGKSVSNANLTVAQTGSSFTNGGIRGTEGLLDFIENKGQSMDLGSSAITMADFDAIIKSLDKYRGAKEYAMYCGINLSLDIDDLLAAQGAYAAGGANYGTFQNNKNMALNLGFNSFSRGGYTFHKKTYDLFNHPKLVGATNFNYNGYGICIPMDTQKDAKSGDKIPSLRIRYKAANGYSREMEHWLTGSAVLKNKTNTEDNLKCHYRTERGFEGFGANRYMLIKKS